MKLSGEQRRILQALQQGCHLKVHRTMDGAKVYRLHGAAGGSTAASEEIPADVVEPLERHGCLQSNLKFPAATLLLTERGARAAMTAPTRRSR
jgi:hypothetical protein